MTYSLFEYALMAFNVAIFFWVAHYRPWKAGLRREALIRSLADTEEA